MSRPIFVGFNLLLILIFGQFQKGSIEISHDLPGNLAPGQEAVVTVEINKADISGFAKYQITVQPGITIEPLENAGSSFTFNNQKGKFIWMALPSSKKFTIQYRIKTDAGINGTYSIASRFSYIYESERKNYDLPESTLIVGENSNVLASTGSAEPEEQHTNLNAEVYTNRTITPTGINQWKVNIEINKQNLEGFARIEEIIPEGFTAIDLQSSSAVFVSENEKVKYIWYDIPKNETLNVTYKLLPVIAVDPIEPLITGDFTYLNNSEELIVSIGQIPGGNTQTEILAEENKESDTQNISEELNSEPDQIIDSQTELALAVVTNSNETESEELIPELVTDSDSTDETAQKTPETPVVHEKSAVSTNIVNIPNPETGITYRVQIAAGHNNVKKAEFEKLYGFTEGYNLENIDGWIKYTTGSHSHYESARNDRERINSEYEKFQGPFVTAYNEGARITVQEALMVTNQQWLQ